MLSRFGISFAIFILLIQYAFAGVPETLSYSDWKRQQIDESQNRVEALSKLIHLKKRQIQSDSQVRTEAGFSTDITINRLDTQLFQEQETLDLNKKLSISDYIIMYLTTLPTDKNTYLKVAKQMNAEDMVEILIKYNQQLNSKPTEVLTIPETNVAAKQSNSEINK